MQREWASEWIPKHLALKHLAQTKSMTGYKAGLHSFTSTHLYKPTWAAVLSWGSGSNGGNRGRVFFTRQQPLGLFEKEEDRWGTASAAVLACISMRIKPSTGLKWNATSTSLSKTSSSASSSWQCVDNLHHQQCCTSASLVLPPWHESSFPLLCPPTIKLKQNSCKTMDVMRRVQLKWQRGWVQRKRMFTTDRLISSLSKARRYCSFCKQPPTRDKQALKKIQLPSPSSPLPPAHTFLLKFYKLV